MGMVLGWGAIRGDTSICSNSIKQGPYVFEQPMLEISIPSKHQLLVTRLTVTKDVEIAILSRSFWKSYCYMGGSIDPNTGCYRSIVQDLPSNKEANEWIKHNKCLIGRDCTDCWGTDAQACIDPKRKKELWVEGKELEKHENNNHFLFHTCNLSWRCGIQNAKFPTFLTRRNHKWVAYTELANGTELDLSEQDFWQFEDIILKKTKHHRTVYTEVAEVQCFINNKNETACFDPANGMFFELTEDWHCFQRTCYMINSGKEENNITKRNHDDIAKLKGASLSDVAMVLTQEKMLSEEMRYNFGKFSEEIIELRKVVTNVILSVAKIDDRLIGNVMGQPAKSKFLGPAQFLLSPCTEPAIENSNCVKDLIFKNGRWIKMKDEADCLNLKNIKKISPFINQELWFPQMKEQQLVGTSENFEGWSYYANERDNLDKAMRWTTNAQQVTSLSDIYNLPNGVFNKIMSGFAISHTILYIAIGAALFAIYLLVKRNRQHEEPLAQRYSSQPRQNEIEIIEIERPATPNDIAAVDQIRPHVRSLGLERAHLRRSIRRTMRRTSGRKSFVKYDREMVRLR